ncbi:serine/threonine-protein kinase [Pendulispora albinea]|uniref:Serine/threonine protein kinase n=1 Tax=Pendulispora albinea TaxID=2741071 RepID=A0ABZ2M3E6_9BACT
MLSTSQETREPVMRTLPRSGDVLVGKYRVERVLGEGGMCVVYAAEHLQLEDWVAIKVLRTDWVDRPDVVERFLREGKTATRIRSEHVVRTFDVGTLDDGTPCLVMEYLVGSDLDALLTANGPLPVPAAVDYLLQAGEAIAEAHQLGIVHRDLKPANLFLTRRADGSPWIKVLDFGISKLSPSVAMRSGKDLGLTGHSIMGSPRYMSPEQMRASAYVDMRADIWAIGAILHELISGRPPFDADTMPEICAQILQTPAPPLTSICPDVPPELEAVVLRCLEKNPSNRFANLGELAAALREFGTPAGRASANRIMGIFQTATTTYGRISGQTIDEAPAWGSTDPTWRPGPPRKRSLARMVGIAFGSSAIVACGAITALFALRHAQEPSRPAVAPAPTPVLSWEGQPAPAAPALPTNESTASANGSASAPAAAAPSTLAPSPATAPTLAPAAPADSTAAKHSSTTKKPRSTRPNGSATATSTGSSESMPAPSSASSPTPAPAGSETLFEERK